MLLPILFVTARNLTAIRQNKSFGTVRCSNFFLTDKQIPTVVVRQASVIIILSDKPKEGRALLNVTIAKLNACSSEGFMRVTRCAVDVVASAAPNDTIIAENLRSEAQQIAQAFINTPNVRHLQCPYS